MGTSRNAAEMAVKIDRLGADIKAAKKGNITEASMVLKEAVLSRGRKASGGDLVLSGVGKDGKGKLGANFKALSGDESELRAIGPWQLVEFDTSPRVITSRYGGGSRTTRARAIGATAGRRVKLGTNRVYVASVAEGVERSGDKIRGSINIPGIGWRRYARVRRGSKGTRPFAKGINDGIPGAVRVLRRRNVDIARKVLR